MTWWAGVERGTSIDDSNEWLFQCFLPSMLTVFAVRQAPPAWTPGGGWIPGQARNDVVGPALICGPFFYPRIKTFAHKSRKLNPDHEANAPDAQLQWWIVLGEHSDYNGLEDFPAINKILEILRGGDRYNHFMTDARRPSGASDGKLSVMIWSTHPTIASLFSPKLHQIRKLLWVGCCLTGRVNERR